MSSEASEDEPLYVVCPGRVKSRTDGDIHFVTAGQLVRLYGLENKPYRTHRGRSYPERAVFCGPRFDGNYKRVGEQHG